MPEAPIFEGPLRNPNVSEEADRKLDLDMDRLPAIAARKLIPEFAKLEDQAPLSATAKPKYQTAAEQRLPHALEIKEKLEETIEVRKTQEEEAQKGPSSEEMIRLLRDPQASSADTSSESTGSAE